MMMQFYARSPNMDHVAEMQRLGLAHQALRQELLQANLTVEKCRTELALAGNHVHNGDSQTGELVREPSELRNFKVTFVKWVNDRRSSCVGTSHFGIRPCSRRRL